MTCYFVRIGAFAELHTAIGPQRLERHCRVVVRTPNGLQLGQIVGPAHPVGPARQLTDPQGRRRILRATTDADELLIRRLERHKRQAIERCRAAIASAGSNAVLLDVDQMLDGGTLVMHFLGQPDSAAAAITKQIAEQYESIVRTRHFAKLLRDGCGPDCGVSGQCETGSCGNCAAAGACNAK